MAFRTNSAAVKEIWSSGTTIINFDPFIQAANIVVTNAFSDVTSVDAPTLSEIERWLAAHFATAIEPSIMEEELGDARMRYAMPKMGDNLKASIYGIMALSLDPVGALQEYGKRAATIEAIEGP